MDLAPRVTSQSLAMKLIATFQACMALCSSALLAGAVTSFAQNEQREPELVEKARQGDAAKP